jgi:hypothetical protein
MKSALLCLLLIAAPMLAQTAKVVELKPEEAAEAKQLHDAADRAKKAADEFDAKIGERYVWSEGSTANSYSLKPGWPYGFEFSDDYRFIVPKPYQAQAPSACGYGFYMNPATWSETTAAERLVQRVKP